MKEIGKIKALVVLVMLTSMVIAPAILAQPGQNGEPPGQGGTPPGQVETPPGQDESPPGIQKNSGWTVEGDKLYTTNLNSNVGMGTMDPQYKLDVNGDARITGTLYVGSGGAQHLVITPEGNVGIGTADPIERLDVEGNIHVSGKVLASAYASNSPLIFEAPVGTERARIDDVTGNFGIGTDNPQAKLHIDTGTRDIYFGKDSDIGEGSAVANLPALFADSVLRVRQRVEIWDDNNGDNYLDIRSGSSQVIKLTPNDDSWLNGGNVGIGTENPQSRLHLLVPDDTGLRIQAGEGGWGSARVEFWSDPIGHPAEWRPGYIASGDTGGWTGRLDFYTNGAGFGSKTDSVLGMSIRNGNVGIGTNDPQAQLHIDTGTSDVYFGKDSDLGEGSAVANLPALFADSVLRVRQRVEIWDDNNGDNYLDIRSGSSQVIKLTPNDDSWLNGGNVGIGTENPQSRLHLLVPDDTGLRIQAGEGGWGSARVEFWSDPIGHPNEWRPGYIASGDSGGFTGRLDFYTNGAGFGSKTDSVLGMSIRNGNVGIGTSSPEAKLDVEVSSGGAATIGSSLCSATGEFAVAMGHGTTADGHYSTAMGRDTTAIGWYSTAMGLDTTAVGSASTTMGQGTTAYGHYSTAMGYGTNASGLISTAMGRSINANGNYSFGIGLDSIPNTITQDNTMAIMGGKVGIGTVNPDYKLSIGDGTYERIHFSGSINPNNPPPGSVVIYFDGTDLKAKNSSGTTKTIANF